jgi:hypothetical protein
MQKVYTKLLTYGLCSVYTKFMRYMVASIHMPTGKQYPLTKAFKSQGSAESAMQRMIERKGLASFYTADWTLQIVEVAE